MIKKLIIFLSILFLMGCGKSITVYKLKQIKLNNVTYGAFLSSSSQTLAYTFYIEKDNMIELQQVYYKQVKIIEDGKLIVEYIHDRWSTTCKYSKSYILHINKNSINNNIDINIP